ncbi:hypothetical protein AZE42_10953 [Rhizopogon vesiculosus]|uniref:DNA replication factor Dna2 N-terminal domain-containing protein n=1 Tax=Rhizopogon vesiculosus TaxID=180088 RepID=A0A1J8PL18_9AGAM|nr:hypothetical protein AZE42_10953 [Rhizopogon vesiculosus]
MEDDFLTPKRPRFKPKTAVMPAKRYIKQTCTCCVVDDIREDNSIVLSVRVPPSGDSRTVVLCDDWVDADIRKGDVINVLGDFDSVGMINIQKPVCLYRTKSELTPSLIPHDRPIPL